MMLYKNDANYHPENNNPLTHFAQKKTCNITDNPM